MLALAQGRGSMGQIMAFAMLFVFAAAWPAMMIRPNCVEHKRALASTQTLSIYESILVQMTSELTRLGRKYPVELMDKHILVGNGVGRSITSRLLGALLDNQTGLTIGVTGGSSTAGDFAWPARLANWMTQKLHIPNVTVWNAAAGSTSQLVTAPCIRSLIGDHVDVLMWEFGMNDEYPHFMNGSEPFAAQHYYRHRAAEAYIRQAIALNPVAIGFLHFWDIEIHGFQSTGSTLPKDRTVPNRSYHPTTSVMRYYDSVFDRHFSVDVIGFMWDAGLFRNKSEILRDPHHPNDFSYDVSVDMLAYCMLKACVNFINGASSLDRDHVGSSHHAQLSLWDYPTLTHDSSERLSPYVLPSQRLLGHCLTAWRPHFAPQDSAIVVVDNHESVVDVGKAAPGRHDRQLRFVVGPCNATSQLVLEMHIPNIAVVMIDCGMLQRDCARNLEVSFEDTGPAFANVDVADDVVGYFFSWVHETAVLVPRTPRRLSLCARSEEKIKVARISVMQQMM